jgi:hypothetical protein
MHGGSFAPHDRLLEAAACCLQSLPQYLSLQRVAMNEMRVGGGLRDAFAYSVHDVASGTEVLANPHSLVNFHETTDTEKIFYFISITIFPHP